MPSILLIDSDPVARAALKAALRGEAGITIVGETEATPSAVELVARLAPGMVVLGLSLRRELELATRLMREAPRPLLLLTAERKPEPGFVARALGVGALDVRPKLPAPASEEYEKQRAMLARMIRVLASVPVVTRLGTPRAEAPILTPPQLKAPSAPATPSRTPGAVARARPRADLLLVIGASTGGPPVLETILKGLPNPFPLPVAIVQHMTAGFNREFVRWLADNTGRRAVMVEEPVYLEPGVVYLAADDQHLIFTSRFEVAPSSSGERRFQRPSIDVLFESAAKNFGGQVAAVLLTGMGSDGVEGMATLKGLGAFTLAQVPESCAVDSMPRGAIERGVVDLIADPEGIAAALAVQYACGTGEGSSPRLR